MHLTIEIPPAQLRDVLPSDHELAQAAGRGVSNIVKRRLVERDRRGRSDGLPRTGYYGDAASGVTTEVSGSRAVVTIHKEGVALHYYGGVVYPTDAKALAIPKSIQGAGKRPAEADPDRTKFALVWPKGKTTGTLRDKETDEVVYLLVSKAKIKEDKTVLPTDAELESAGMAAMEAML
ncbi:MAG: hypothetical protein IKC14_10435 [Kiritimatiellae bacterium]|nr:hypothetical protein [Kiritimatiellia bacterium]